MFTLRREFSTPSISSDAQYVFQNCIRVFRAISDLSLLKDCAKTAEIASSWAIAVELQVPILYHPLYGYELNRNQQAEGRSKHVRMQRAAMVPSGLTEALAALQRQGVDTAALAACSSLLPLRRIVGNQLPERDLMYVVQLAQSFPRVEIAAEAQSYGERLFKIVFNASLSSRSPQETFLVHLQDSQGTVIFSDRLSFSKLHNSTTVRCVIARDRVFPLLITALSDRWLQCKTQLVLRSATSLFNNDKPGGVRSRCSTIAAVPPLPTSVLSARERKFLFPSSTSESMNSIMTSTFFQLRHTFEDFLMAGEEWLRETLERVAMFAVFQELESWEREAARIDRGNGACGRSKVVIVCKDRAEAWKWYRQWGLKFQQQFETEVSCCDVTSSANLHVLGAEGLLTLDGPLLLSQARVVIVHGLQPGATCAELELAAAAVKKQQSTEVEKKRTRMITLVSSVINNVNDIQRWLHVPPPSCFLPFRHGIPIGVTLKILSFPRGSSPDRTILNLVGRTAGRPSLVVCRTFGEARRLSMLVARKVAEQEADEDLFRVAAVFQDQSLSALASHGVGLLGKRMLRTGAGAGSGAGAGGAGAGDGRVVMSDDELLIVELHRANKVRLLLVDVEYLLSSLPSNLLQLEHAIVALPPLCRIDKHGAAGRGRFASFVADSPSSIYSSLCQTLGKFKWTSGNARTASLVVHEKLGLRRATDDLYPGFHLLLDFDAYDSPLA
ncbi:hypothetical protein GUITHDRAFT_120633 [Guillardia theta CCMP2712]|uniref:SEC63 domain-containing protein n=1 Tax=Guillardia theta (strain CCMP2712) TaxID=905079 RepID=L1IBH4_GUITC|nr:hypothetical protein GUITHDRAFT_120633 [Guillardia theta CCMP2712]EKX33190.1 hypothetical protein GUITHDRAFT_120633 [Guillardia theta CCMP2712]|eukprot:XP_005820170.1 hypothetical protein GUITHDRAFT_120633 [Guillardia theta CCMP2712]